jgi:predicted Ser/Thr protein kinase
MPADVPPDHTPPTHTPPLPTIAGDPPLSTPGAPPGCVPLRPTVAPPGYEILEEIGRGGMGVVFRARQVGLDRIVALKMLRSAEYAFAEDVRRFLVEAQAVAKLSHPGIVRVFDFGQHAGLPYYAMELITGGSLHERANKAPIAARHAAEILVGIARAVQHAHDNGVLHRDLKPENVLLTDDGRPTVTDFGLARVSQPGSEDRTRSGTILGTPGYAAPEQAAGRTRQVGHASDVYSLGAVLYRLLVGRPPFMAATPHETLLQVISEDPTPPSRIDRSVPRDLETICMKCLNKEPAKRYHSAGELADDLERFVHDEPILARPTGSAERVAKWVRRNRVVASLLLVIAAALVVGSVASALFAVSASRSRDRADERALDEKKARDEAERERTRAERELARAEMLVYAGQLAVASSPPATPRPPGSCSTRRAGTCAAGSTAGCWASSRAPTSAWANTRAA